jgi:hypothetical protein
MRENSRRAVDRRIPDVLVPNGRISDVLMQGSDGRHREGHGARATLQRPFSGNRPKTFDKMKFFIIFRLSTQAKELG